MPPLANTPTGTVAPALVNVADHNGAPPGTETVTVPPTATPAHFATCKPGPATNPDGPPPGHDACHEPPKPPHADTGTETNAAGTEAESGTAPAKAKPCGDNAFSAGTHAANKATAATAAPTDTRRTRLRPITRPLTHNTLTRRNATTPDAVATNGTAGTGFMVHFGRLITKRPTKEDGMFVPTDADALKIPRPIFGERHQGQGSSQSAQIWLLSAE